MGFAQKNENRELANKAPNNKFLSPPFNVNLRPEILHPCDNFRSIHGQFHSYARIDVSGVAQDGAQRTGAIR